MIVLILAILIHFYIVITQLQEQNKILEEKNEIFRIKLSILIEKIIKIEEDIVATKLNSATRKEE